MNNENLQRQLELETKIATILGYGFVLNSPNGLFYRSGRVPKFTRDWAVIGPLMIEHDAVPMPMIGYENDKAVQLYGPNDQVLIGLNLTVRVNEFPSTQEAFLFAAAQIIYQRLVDNKAVDDKIAQDALDAKRAKSSEQLQRQREAEARKGQA